MADWESRNARGKTRGLQADLIHKQFTLLLVELFTLKIHLVPLFLSQFTLISSDTL